MQLQLARFNLGQVQQIIDQGKQMAGAGLHGAQLLILIGSQRAGQLHQQGAGEADDGVQGGAQLMAHAGQKAVFGQVGLCQLLVLFLQCPIGALALGDVPDGAADQKAFLGFQRAEADLDGEFALVLAQAE